MTPAEKRYAQIMNMKRPVHDGDAFSREHPPMPPEKRAKIFMPFDALRGFSAEVDIIQGNLILEEKKDLDASETGRINEILRKTSSAYEAGIIPQLSVTHFYPRKMREDAVLVGTYETVEGSLTKMDVKEHFLMVDDMRIGFDDILAIEADWTNDH